MQRIEISLDVGRLKIRKQAAINNLIDFLNLTRNENAGTTEATENDFLRLQLIHTINAIEEEIASKYD